MKFCHIVCHTLCVMCPMSHVRCHMLGVTCQVSNVTCHVSFVTFFSRWSVCYQQGLPCYFYFYLFISKVVFPCCFEPLKKEILLKLEGMASYASQLLAPAEGFGLWPRLLLPFGKKRRIMLFHPILSNTIKKIS